MNYRLTAAYAQLGSQRPYALVKLATRMGADGPEVNILGDWHPFPKDGPRPSVAKMLGLPVAGIAAEWEI